MRCFIDGYNVTRRDPATADLSLEEQRRELERRLRIRSLSLLGTCDYTIIWDAAGGFAGSMRTSPRATNSEYTRKPTADDAIVAKVRFARERVMVVTSDNELANRCKGAASFGVDIMPSEALFEGAVAKKKKSKRAPMRRDIGIPSNANEINRELKELWGIED